MKIKLTFKTIKPMGKYRSFDHHIEHIIKWNKKQIGLIHEDTNIQPNDSLMAYSVRLMVYKKDIDEDNNPNCEWKWIRFKHIFTDLQEAKDWICVYIDEFVKVNKIYSMEE